MCAQQLPRTPIPRSKSKCNKWKSIRSACLVAKRSVSCRLMTKLSGSTDRIKALEDEFRRHLEIFYACLKLAPPYDSVEKAIKLLTTTITSMPAEERTRILGDPTLTWIQYRQAFVDSGLSLKHRGIILGLIRSHQTSELPAEYAAFLDAYTTINR